MRVNDPGLRFFVQKYDMKVSERLGVHPNTDEFET